MDVSREKIKLPKQMMRQIVSERDMEDLVKSIKEIGMINPIIVRKMDDDYELVAGLRRLMAADVLQMEKVYVRVIRAGDEKAERIKMDENREREDINPVDEGIYFFEMMERFHWNQKQLAERFRVSESYVSQRVGSMGWPDRLKKEVVDGKLTFSVAREFAQIKDLGEMERVIDQAISSGVSPAVAARWRHECNRESLVGDVMSKEELEVMMRGGESGILYSCQVCGGPGREIGYKIMRVCFNCLEVIKVGQEKGVFVYGENEKGATQGEGVE